MVEKNVGENLKMIPAKERARLRLRAIKAFHRQGYSLEEISEMSQRHPHLFYSSSGVSKTTIFFGVNGRSKKKPVIKN